MTPVPSPVRLERAVLGPRVADRDYGIIAKPAVSLAGGEEASLMAFISAARRNREALGELIAFFPLGEKRENQTYALVRAFVAVRDGIEGVFAYALILPADFLERIEWGTHRLLLALPEHGPFADMTADCVLVEQKRLGPGPDEALPAYMVAQMADALLSRDHPIEIIVPTGAKLYEAFRTVWHSLSGSERRAVAYCDNARLVAHARNTGVAPFDVIFNSADAPQLGAPLWFAFGPRGLLPMGQLVDPGAEIIRDLAFAYPKEMQRLRPGQDSVGALNGIFGQLQGRGSGPYIRVIKRLNEFDLRNSPQAAEVRQAVLAAYSGQLPRDPERAAQFIDAYLTQIEPLMANPPLAYPVRLAISSYALLLLPPVSLQTVLDRLFGNDTQVGEAAAQDMARATTAEAFDTAARTAAKAYNGSPSAERLKFCRAVLLWAPDAGMSGLRPGVDMLVDAFMLKHDHGILLDLNMRAPGSVRELIRQRYYAHLIRDLKAGEPKMMFREDRGTVAAALRLTCQAKSKAR